MDPPTAQRLHPRCGNHCGKGGWTLRAKGTGGLLWCRMSYKCLSFLKSGSQNHAPESWGRTQTSSTEVHSYSVLLHSKVSENRNREHSLLLPPYSGENYSVRQYTRNMPHRLLESKPWHTIIKMLSNLYCYYFPNAFLYIIPRKTWGYVFLISPC